MRHKTDLLGCKFCNVNMTLECHVYDIWLSCTVNTCILNCEECTLHKTYNSHLHTFTISCNFKLVKWSCREGTAKFADMENTSMTLGRHQRKKSSTSTLNKKKNVWDPSVSKTFRDLTNKFPLLFIEFFWNPPPSSPYWIFCKVYKIKLLNISVLNSSGHGAISRYFSYWSNDGGHRISRSDGRKVDQLWEETQRIWNLSTNQTATIRMSVVPAQTRCSIYWMVSQYTNVRWQWEVITSPNTEQWIWPV